MNVSVNPTEKVSLVKSESKLVRSRSNVIVHFLRHAHPAHKVLEEPDLTMPDPGLSAKGFLQCEEFSLAFRPQAQYITHILSCPMKRTLQTACLAFAPVLARGCKVIALPELQNLDKGPSGRGLDPAKLVASPEFKDKVRLEYVSDDWDLKEQGRWSPDNLEWRIDHMRGFLRGLGAHTWNMRAEVVVVSHGSFLREFVKDVKWEDATIKSFRFDDQGQFEEIGPQELEQVRSSFNKGSDTIETSVSAL